MLTTLLLLPLALADDPTLAAPVSAVVAREPAALSLRAAGLGRVSVDACAPFELERQVEGRWVPQPAAACPKPMTALSFADETTLSVTVPSPGTWRVKVAWGTGCKADRPFVEAACGALGFATSPPFEVKAAPTPG